MSTASANEETQKRKERLGLQSELLCCWPPLAQANHLILK